MVKSSQYFSSHVHSSNFPAHTSCLCFYFQITLGFENNTKNSSFKIPTQNQNVFILLLATIGMKISFLEI